MVLLLQPDAGPRVKWWDRALAIGGILGGLVAIAVGAVVAGLIWMLVTHDW